MIKHYNSNPFLNFYKKMVIDANNPLANFTTIPINNAAVTTVIDNTINRNTFSGGSSFQFKTNSLSTGNHSIFMPGSATDMTCPYDAAKNGYSGAFTITFFVAPDSDSGITAHLFGQLPLGDGFSIGQIDDADFLVGLGAGLYSEAGQFVAAEWHVYTMCYDGGTNVSFFKDGAFVSTVAGSPVVAATNDFILGGYNTGSGTLNFVGDLNLLAYDNTVHTNNQIFAAHHYALSRL
jgi:hypothetical protein